LLDRYFDQLHHIVVMEPKKIMKKYLKYGTFLPDLLGSFPTDIAFVKTWQENTVARELVSLICGFRVFSLSSYMTKIAHACDASMPLYEVCIMIFWLIVAFQWQSCLYWLVPITTTSIHLPKQPGGDSWIQRYLLLQWTCGCFLLFL